MKTSNLRPTRFSFAKAEQTSKGLVITCSDDHAAPQRGANGGIIPVKSPPLLVPDGVFTQEKLAIVVEALGFLEEAYGLVHVGYEADPDRNRELIERAVNAEKRVEAAQLEAQRLELEANVAREEQAALLAMTQAEAQRVATIAAAKTKELATIDADLAAKRAAHAEELARMTAIAQAVVAQTPPVAPTTPAAEPAR